MIKSMTGYGQAREVRNLRDITVEVRSVNNRYLDCTIKMPRLYLFAEDAMKKRVQGAVSRGKVDVFVTVDASAAGAEQVSVNRGLAESYLRAMNSLMELTQDTLFLTGNSLQIRDGMTPFEMAKAISRFPDVLTVTRAETDAESVGADLCAVLDAALKAFNTARAAEGEKLAEDISARLDTIERLTGAVEARSPETVSEYREKLLRRMREVLQGASVDEQRILTEAAIYADKVAVDEETVRLRSHVAQFRTMLKTGTPQGRKMDFLIQEMNRESNTIGSKCSDVAIAQTVVELKAEVEKIREQVQNIE